MVDPSKSALQLPVKFLEAAILEIQTIMFKFTFPALSMCSSA
jgi:hypothetical protein